jgi:hypothetical protein
MNYKKEEIPWPESTSEQHRPTPVGGGGKLQKLEIIFKCLF